MSDLPPAGMRLFQIPEPELAKLEAYLPLVCDRLREAACEPRMQIILTEVKEILSNVRWNYGPPTEMQILPASPRDEA